MQSMRAPIHDKRQVQPTGKVPGNQVQQAKDAILRAFEKSTKGMPADQLRVLANDLVANFRIVAEMAGVK